MPSKKTYKQISDFTRIATVRYRTSDRTKENKLLACITDLIGDPEKQELGSFFFLNDQYRKEQRKIYRKYASEDLDGNILKDANGNYVYTKNAEEDLEKELEALQDKEVEFEPSFCPVNSLPQEMPKGEYNAYLGFVIE